MKVVYFIETNGRRYYKCDTFWTMSSNKTDAKVHGDSLENQEYFFETLCGLLTLVKKSVKDSKKLKESYDFFEGGIYGYQVIEGNFTGYSVDADQEISDPIYLKVIDSVSGDGKYTTCDYKKYDRINKLNKILTE